MQIARTARRRSTSCWVYLTHTARTKAEMVLVVVVVVLVAAALGVILVVVMLVAAALGVRVVVLLLTMVADVRMVLVLPAEAEDHDMAVVVVVLLMVAEDHDMVVETVKAAVADDMVTGMAPRLWLEEALGVGLEALLPRYASICVSTF